MTSRSDRTRTWTWKPPELSRKEWKLARDCIRRAFETGEPGYYEREVSDLLEKLKRL